MKMLKNFISMAALTALLGCEHQDGKTGNAVSAATDRNPAAQSQSDDSSETNAVDNKAVIPPFGSITVISTNEQSEVIWSSDGYGFDNFTLTNLPDADEGTNSIPTNSLTNTGSTNSLFP